MTAAADDPATTTPGEDVPSLRQLIAAEARANLARRKISGRRFAVMVGQSTAWTDRRLSGATAIDADDIELFARTLGITAQELLDGAFREQDRIAARLRNHQNVDRVIGLSRARTRSPLVPLPGVFPRSARSIGRSGAPVAELAAA